MTTAKTSRMSSVSPAEASARRHLTGQPAGFSLRDRGRLPLSPTATAYSFSTYPAPRLVWRRRLSPPSSSLRRRFEMKTSIVLVESIGS